MNKNKKAILKGFLFLLGGIIIINWIIITLCPKTEDITLISHNPNQVTYKSLTTTENYLYGFLQGFATSATNKKDIYESQLVDIAKCGSNSPDCLKYVTLPVKEIKSDGSHRIKECLIKEVMESGASKSYIESCN